MPSLLDSIKILMLISLYLMLCKIPFVRLSMPSYSFQERKHLYHHSKTLTKIYLEIILVTIFDNFFSKCAQWDFANDDEVSFSVVRFTSVLDVIFSF